MRRLNILSRKNQYKPPEVVESGEPTPTKNYVILPTSKYLKSLKSKKTRGVLEKQIEKALEDVRLLLEHNPKDTSQHPSLAKYRGQKRNLYKISVNTIDRIVYEVFDSPEKVVELVDCGDRYDLYRSLGMKAKKL